MRFALSPIFLALWLVVGHSGPVFAQGRISYSLSGDFVVHAWPGREPAPDPLAEKALKLVTVKPNFLAITAEHIKRTLAEELRQPSSLASKIHLRIQPAGRGDEPVGIVSAMYSDGWVYHVHVPIRVNETRLVKGIVQSLLLEFASRGRRKSATIPTWLVEGLTQRITRSPFPTTALDRKVVNLQVVGTDRLANAREVLRTNSCLTFHQLGFPEWTGMPSESQAAVYEASAHLFTHELLSLPSGPELLASFIRELPMHWNWQTAFFKVYAHQFQSPLDLEKWWSLSWIEFRSRGGEYQWPPRASFEKLSAMLRTTVERWTSTNSLPTVAELSLREVLTAPDLDVQSQILRDKIERLRFARPQMHPAAARFCVAYMELFERFVEDRRRLDYQPGLRQGDEAKLRNLVQRVLGRLEEIDREAIQTIQALPAEMKQPDVVVTQPPPRGIQ